ncbi:MAG: hypothetical protein RLZZ553_850 [Verrucomicrobiota bacterium]
MIVVGRWQKGKALCMTPLSRAENNGLRCCVNQSVVHFSEFSEQMRFWSRQGESFIEKSTISPKILKFLVNFMKIWRGLSIDKRFDISYHLIVRRTQSNAMIRISQPSNLELQALTVLWHQGPSTVAKVLEELPDGKERAYTTVLTVMQNLEKKGHVRRVKHGRAHVYQAAHPQKSVVSDAVEEFVTNTFGGRLGEAIMALLASGSLTAEEKTGISRSLRQSKTLAPKKTAKKPATAKKVARKTTKKTAVKSAKK